jgi:15-cis-phytoene synthase
MGSDAIVATGLAELKGSRSSFRFSFSFLPKKQRDALRAVYAFCRSTDDIVDNNENVDKKLERLGTWRRELERALSGTSSSTVLNRLSAIAKKFNIPVDHFHALLRGVEMDLVKNRYETFEELREYCTLVASSVGLMSLEIFRPRNDVTREYAVNLGIALQLTNILRDVGTDANYGRIYLPLEDLRRFHYSEAELFSRRFSPQFRELMEFEAGRAEEYFRKAQACLPREDRRAMFAAKIMERIYYHTLLRIREAGYDVFTRPVTLPRTTQFLIAVKYWVMHRILGG